MFKGAVLRYLISDALSLLGNSIAGVVLPLVLLARTGDALAAGSLALICAVPQFVLGIVGGAVLDRVNRKAICVASDSSPRSAWPCCRDRRHGGTLLRLVRGARAARRRG